MRERLRTLAAVLAVVTCLVGVGAVVLGSAPSARAAALDFGGLVRTYELHVPAGSRPSALVLNLHAAGATGRDQAALTHYDAVADAHGFAVAYPDGIDMSWADGRGASIPDRQGVDDVGFLTALASKLVSDFGINPGRVYVTGLSAGAFMANRLACDRADLFAAIAPVAGTLGVNVGCAPSRPVAVMATYGTADPIVPFDGGPMTGRGGVSDIVSAPALVQRWRQLNGCADTPAQQPLAPSGDGTHTDRIDYPRCAPGGEVVFMRVDGGGHTWPGAPEVLPAQAVGLASRGFDASEASWRFFDSHGR
ncbi:alpha/beta hydrolase family esterase [Mycolicibacterium sp. J2]|uniref:extracellular catalytic domain type 1 short-chain-length polyhydroxyalkanoate depolymerase n=1 Tax=Mycolicibacterium sp. J2 TaxID=2993511 RepID=UPI00224B2391|nr:PHB depolymerase family esterase [Mycolicibacterium sp. J2]MCX2713221.1 prolyl oligopeptidase family serine peptidase [Mycolicibacterium sp. J2]